MVKYQPFYQPLMVKYQLLDHETKKILSFNLILLHLQKR